MVKKVQKLRKIKVQNLKQKLFRPFWFILNHYQSVLFTFRADLIFKYPLINKLLLYEWNALNWHRWNLIEEVHIREPIRLKIVFVFKIQNFESVKIVSIPVIWKTVSKYHFSGFVLVVSYVVVHTMWLYKEWWHFHKFAHIHTQTPTLNRLKTLKIYLDITSVL